MKKKSEEQLRERVSQKKQHTRHAREQYFWKESAAREAEDFDFECLNKLDMFGRRKSRKEEPVELKLDG